MRGTITKVVNTHGSSWGRIRPNGAAREIFFNPASFVRPEDFSEAEEGFEVEFNEDKDRVNGARAVQLVFVVEVAPGSDFSRLSGR